VLAYQHKLDVKVEEKTSGLAGEMGVYIPVLPLLLGNYSLRTGSRTEMALTTNTTLAYEALVNYCIHEDVGGGVEQVFGHSIRR
jgi:hypothetical protein